MKASRRTRDSVLALLGLSVALSCGSAPPGTPGSEATESQSAPIHANPGSTITKSTEPTALTGQFPQVLFVSTGSGTCTGTVIAPYAILSAAHCNPASQKSLLSWSGVQDQGSGIDNPYFRAPYIPAWVSSLRISSQMYDQTVFFDPNLTPQFLAAHQLNPVPVNPGFYPSTFTTVGVGSTGGGSRDFIAEQFVQTTANSAAPPIDGYLTGDGTTPNFGVADPGDSGGPHLGLATETWTDGSTFVTGMAIAATTEGAFNINAPLMYNPGIGITETPNQQLTVKLNSMWAKARADDADGDGVPNECDSDPANPIGSVNLCPPPVGGPVGAAAVTVPAAQLQCPFGTLPVGLKGTFGSTIHSMAVECDQLQCFAGTTCSGTRTTSDYFSPNTGNSYETACANGERMVGLAGTSDSANLYSLTAQCLTSTGTIHSASTGGVSTSGSPFSFDCAANKLAGFQARSTSLSTVTGLQAICAPTTESYSVPVGAGPGQNAMRCPPGQVAVGLGSAARGPGSDIFMTGLLCTDKTAIAAGQAVGANQLTVVRSGFEMGNFYSAAIEPQTNLHVPSTWVESFCPTGSAMTGVTFGWDTQTQPGLAWVSSIQTIQCLDIRAPNGATTTVNVNTGTAANSTTTYALSTSPSPVDGFVTCDDQLSCGLMLHGSGPPVAPTSLTDTSATLSGVNLSWTASSTVNVSYTVYRSTTSPVTPATSTPVAADLAGTTFVDTLPAPGTTNFYVVVAVNGDGQSWPSNQLSVVVPPMPGPTGLTATASVDSEGANLVNLSWNNTNPNTIFNIYRSTTAAFTPSPATQIASLVEGTTYEDEGSGSRTGLLSTATPYFYFIEVSQSGGTSLPSNEASVTTLPLQIDCGSTNAVPPYVADEFFTGGGGVIAHANGINVSAVTNPAPAAVYQTARAAPITYTLSSFFVAFEPNSTHTVRLHFAETYFATAMSREFNVTINGTQVLTKFDIFAAAGAKNKAIVEAFTVKADANGVYTIQITSVKNVGMISGIEVL